MIGRFGCGGGGRQVGEGKYQEIVGINYGEISELLGEKKACQNSDSRSKYPKEGVCLGIYRK